MIVDFCAYDEPGRVGGPEVWLRRLLPDLRSLGIRPRVKFFAWKDPSSCSTIQALREDGFECDVTKWLGYTENNVKWLLERTRESPPDVFVPNLVTPAFLTCCELRKSGIPSIGVIHSDAPFYEGLVERFVLDRQTHRVSGLVCVSDFLLQRIKLRRPVGVEVRKIPCGVPVPERVAVSPEKTLRIAYVGRLVEDPKRISDIARVFCRAVREVPNTEAAIFGTGPDQLNVEKILADSGSPRLQVQLMGKVDGAMIQDRLMEFHVIVLLSDYEGLPMALMEAMACGCVPVCLKIRSGIPELVEHGKTGLLVEDRNESFVSAIRRLKNEKGLWDRLSGAARTKIKSEYGREVCAAQWLDLVRHLHQTAGPRRPIRIPRRLNLPPVHPQLRAEDTRQPAGPRFTATLGHKMRGAGSRIKRRLAALIHN